MKILFDEKSKNYIGKLRNENNGKWIEINLIEKRIFTKKDGSKMICYPVGSGVWFWHVYSLDKIPKNNNSIIIANIKNINMNVNNKCVEMNY